MVIISERIYEKDAPLIYDLLGVNEEVAAGNFNAENYFNRAAELIPILQKAFVCPPIRLESYKRPEAVPAPLLGENTDEIMRNYGYSDEKIAEMKKRCSETACKAGENTHCKVGENVHCKMGDIMI